MPKNKDFKRIVRARMQKSGESYTAARLQLLNKKGARPPATTADLIARGDRGSGGATAGASSLRERVALAGMKDAAVEAKTGKAWLQWVSVLDAAGARDMSHREIAAHLAKVEGLPGWWTQMVAVGYERITGLREPGQRRGATAGSYATSKTRTFPVSVAALFRAFRQPRQRAKWLDGAAFAVRTAKPSRSMRARLDGRLVILMFHGKGPEKSVVSIEHTELPTKAARDAAKRFWTERLDALAAVLREK